MAIPIIRRRRVLPGSADDRHFRKFVAPPVEPLGTPDRRSPNVSLRLKLIETVDLPIPYRLRDGSRRLRMWVIADPKGRAPQYPSPTIRVRAGQVVHATVSSAKGPHTVHWHGIEPSPMNDGVGKHSFEIEDAYTYQWQPESPGFYFYHCHRNTTLHFEMGLFGALIVDPAKGAGWVRAHSPSTGHLVRYDREAIWVCTAHDSRWHDLNHGHALMHELDPNDPAAFDRTGILNDWRPDVFTISGAVANGTQPLTDTRAAVTARLGQTVLLRVLNAGYAITRLRIGHDVQVVAQDARAYGVPPWGAYSEPWTLASGTALEQSTAQRHDLLFRAGRRGTFPVVIDHMDWRGHGSLGQVRTSITVV